MVMPRSRSMSIELSTCSTISRVGHRPGLLDQPVGERRLAMVDMGDDGEVADVLDRVGGHGARDSRARREGNRKRSSRQPGPQRSCVAYRGETAAGWSRRWANRILQAPFALVEVVASRGFAGCAPKSPMLGNARLWGRAGPRAHFRDAETSRIPEVGDGFRERGARRLATPCGVTGIGTGRHARFRRRGTLRVRPVLARPGRAPDRRRRRRSGEASTR